MTIASTYVCETRLDELPPRTCAVVRRIETDGEEVQRLKSLGLCVGRQIEVVKSGDPLIIKIFGSCIGLSGAITGLQAFLFAGVPVMDVVNSTMAAVEAESMLHNFLRSSVTLSCVRVV